MAYTTIKKPSDYFNTKLYTGDGTSNRGITGVGFQPDWVWVKERTSNSSHRLCDIVRGVTKGLFTNLTSGDQTNTNALLSFDSDGFTVGDNGQVNENTQTYASWNWLASNTTASNTDGSINTTYTSANTTSGFSISKFTGTGSTATVGHGLGVAPKLIIAKALGTTSSWWVYHASVNSTNTDGYLVLNSTAGTADDATIWTTTAPTSSVFSIGSAISAHDYVAYCFAEKTGFSKFGSYTGNGNADGVYQHLGFSASWLMIKRTDSTASWVIFDNKRLGYNVANYQLYANSTSGTGNNVLLDITSQGFKCRANHLDVNGSGASYIYMAFAEAPLVSSNGVPAVAR